jgi:hypothetical protein
MTRRTLINKNRKGVKVRGKSKRKIPTRKPVSQVTTHFKI